MNMTEFQQTISQSGKPVVVDFWAPWCVPCRMTKPLLEKLALEYDEQVEFLAINADDAREVIQHYQVVGIPTVLALREGKIIARVTGAQDEAGYRSIFDGLAAGKAVKVPVSTFDRALRLAAGTLLTIVALTTNQIWLVVIGALIAFMGIYDRCPVWNAIRDKVKG